MLLIVFLKKHSNVSFIKLMNYLLLNNFCCINLVFNRPSRPNLGLKGCPIVLRANHFQISMPRGFVHHYNIYIQPDNCPRMVNHEIICAMVSAYSQVFGSVRPVYDGRNNFFTKDPLPIGNDKIKLEVSFFFKIIL